MYMIRLTAELSGPQVRRTGDVGMAANGASASLLTGCSRQWLEAHADDARASSGRNRRRHCIRHARNRVGQPAVCRRSPRNGASRRHPCILPLSTPASTDALACCFSAAVSLQEGTGAFWPAQKLPPPVAEAGATSGTCLRALSALSRVCRRFQTRLAQVGVRVHILACLLLLCVCR